MTAGSVRRKEHSSNRIFNCAPEEATLARRWSVVPNDLTVVGCGCGDDRDPSELPMQWPHEISRSHTHEALLFPKPNFEQLCSHARWRKNHAVNLLHLSRGSLKHFESVLKNHPRPWFDGQIRLGKGKEHFELSRVASAVPGPQLSGSSRGEGIWRLWPPQRLKGGNLPGGKNPGCPARPSGCAGRCPRGWRCHRPWCAPRRARGHAGPRKTGRCRP